jgi:hypothetical protein
MLRATRDFMRSQGIASVPELSAHLGVPTEVARALLQKWLDKGRIELVQTLPKCSGCDRCGPAGQELYRWLPDTAPEVSNLESGSRISSPSTCPDDGPPQGQACDLPASQSSS